MVGKQYLKSNVKMVQMIFEGAAVNENIIEEDDDKLADIRPEKHVHGSLKR